MRRTILLAISTLILAACSTSNLSFETLPEGDASRGEALFVESISGAPACNSCHLLTEERLVGPGLAGYADRAGMRVEGQSAEEYTYMSILIPADHIVPGFGNTMYTGYRTRLSEQNTADLIAFLLTQ